MLEAASIVVGSLVAHRHVLPAGLQMSTEVADVVNTFKMLAELPTDSLGAYVISMARSASDVLAVVLLQRECGVKVTADSLNKPHTQVSRI